MIAALVLAGCSEPPDPPECLDSDGDGFGDSDYGTDGCDDPTPDCNDGDHYVFPGADELCDGLDNDCDGLVPADEVDDDGDGIVICEGDCDDGDADTFPGAPELCDRIDNDCDGIVPDNEADEDGDGQLVCEGDCNDDDASVHSGAEEGCDGVDTDCDGTLGPDETDDDGDVVTECDGDCDDGNSDVYPDAEELCDGLDTDCDGTVPDEEADGDGDGVSLCEGDCDDSDASMYPGATEICDGIDNDCDEALPFDEFDLDSDGWMECNGDCDDEDTISNPAMSELCDGIDNDCDGALPFEEFDLDGDGWMECEGDCDDNDATLNLDDSDSDGYDTCSLDCDDDNATSYPGATELCDALDNDCDGSLPAEESDDDGDSYLICEGDCDDGDAAVHPDAEEICNDIDDDCDGSLPEDESDDDGDGFAECEGDCDDSDSSNFLGNLESCDGADNDCDGYADDGLGNCAPPEIDHIDGNGSPQGVVDVQGETQGIPNRAEAAHRFQDGWVVTGLRLSTVNSYEMAADGWGGPTFTQVDGLEFEMGGTDMQRTLMLPQALVAGAFVLTLTNPAGDATAQVYILQGEQGDSVLNCTGDDCVLDAGYNLVVDGDLEVNGQGIFGEPAACPAGYEDITLLDPQFLGAVLCQSLTSDDQMVRVGDFWIDRYEVSVWELPDCSGEQYGDPTDGDDFPDPGFPDNGNWEEPAYACSIEGEYPAGHMTWFQAQQACELSGKSLCTNAQWQAAAAGTYVPGCNTGGAGGLEGCAGPGAPWPAGDTQCGGCESARGVMDMVGNEWEWVAEWQGHPGSNGAVNLFDGDPDGDGIYEYGSDGYWAGGPDHDSMASRGADGSWRPSSPAIEDNGHPTGSYYGPAAIRRGGIYNQGANAGIFAMCMAYGPSGHTSATGARCCIER